MMMLNNEVEESKSKQSKREGPGYHLLAQSSLVKPSRKSSCRYFKKFVENAIKR